MVLKSGREVVEINRYGYTEALIVGDEAAAMTDDEWNEYSAYVLERYRLKVAAKKSGQIESNRASFNSTSRSNEASA